MTFAGVFALLDDLRDNITASIRFARRGHINVRMVSGDSLQTAKVMAVRAGIVSQEEVDVRHVCMTGEEFRATIG